MTNNIKHSLLKMSVALVLIITLGLSATLFIYADRIEKGSQGLSVMVIDTKRSLDLNELTYSKPEIKEKETTTDEENSSEAEEDEEQIVPTLPPIKADVKVAEPKSPDGVDEATIEKVPKDLPIEGEAMENAPENGEEAMPTDQLEPSVPSEIVEEVQGANNEEAPVEVAPEEKNESRSGTKANDAEYKKDLNQDVLDIIKTYKIGRYPYLLNNDYLNYNGVTMNLYFQDKLLLKAHPSGNRASHCVGLTFEVMLRALQARNKRLNIDPNDINGMSYKDMYDMALIWFVSSGNKQTNNIQLAVEKYGIGRAIHNLNDARAGDFIDISRENNTGHTGVFINWIKKGNKIVGFRYWSTQTTTNGINYRTEYFNIKDSNGKKYGNVRMDLVFIARINSIEGYKSFQ